MYKTHYNSIDKESGKPDGFTVEKLISVLQSIQRSGGGNKPIMVYAKELPRHETDISRIGERNADYVQDGEVVWIK